MQPIAPYAAIANYDREGEKPLCSNDRVPVPARSNAAVPPVFVR